jgi:hypothetical protein
VVGIAAVCVVDANTAVLFFIYIDIDVDIDVNVTAPVKLQFMLIASNADAATESTDTFINVKSLLNQSPTAVHAVNNYVWRRYIRILREGPALSLN